MDGFCGGDGGDVRESVCYDLVIEDVCILGGGSSTTFMCALRNLILATRLRNLDNL